MGQAPNPGGPQRVSPHVVAKPKPFSEGEGVDDKTTLESQWENEISTTVPQSDGDDKIRPFTDAPQFSNTTATSGTPLEEHTVDDQAANPAASAALPVDPMPGRLVITQGNETGREIEIQPGKPYTIGRGLDNDVVLTDLAVSRKHFDLRHENGAWVIVDRGSGNGTVVNGNVEDNPFMLATGDVIEIGNTVFRFEQPDGSIQREADFDPDNSDRSTVAGKPLRPEAADAVAKPSSHPKTSPPMSRPPASGPAIFPDGQPASTLPLPQMAARAPSFSPGAPMMLGGPAISPAALMTTIPGQAPMPPMYNGYPQTTDIPPHSVHAQMLVVAQQQRRIDPSTALVAPTPYRGVPLATSHGYVPPDLTKRMKYGLVVSGIAVFAAISTIAILKSSSKPLPTAMMGSGAKPGSPVPPPPGPVAPPKNVVTPSPSKPTVTPIEASVDRSFDQPVDPPVVPLSLNSNDPARAAKSDPPRVDSPRADPQPDTTKLAPKPIAKTPKRVTTTATPPLETSSPPPKRVAAIDVGDVNRKADALYRQKKFHDAANVLANASKNLDDADAKGMRSTAEQYERLGRSYFTGMASGAKATEAYEALKTAAASDRAVGKAFESEIESRAAVIAPKAAIMYFANKDYGKAHLAVVDAQKADAGNSTAKTVRVALDTHANDLFSQAKQEIDSSPDDAKDKLKQILKMVDSTTPLYQKAAALLKR